MSTAESPFLGAAPLAAGFGVPSTSLGEVLDRLGCKLFAGDWELVQYVSWAVRAGLFDAMDAKEGTSLEEACARTPLNERGADALVGVLCALGLSRHAPGGRYVLSSAGREYFLRGSPYFIGDQLYPHRRRLPRQYLRERSRFVSQIQLKLIGLIPALRYGTVFRLVNQHARNLTAGVAAVKTGEFAKVRCLVEVAGGSGNFAIPLALEYAGMRIVLTEIPRALKNVRRFLGVHGLESRIEVRGLDVFRRPWDIPACDGIFVGNLLHGFDDESCLGICRESFRHLERAGKIWLHEMIWNENKDGPLITSLWNAAMRNGPGRQRTGSELKSLLEAAGFVSPYVVPTNGAFALVAASRP